MKDNLADVTYGNLGDLCGYYILKYFARNHKLTIQPINGQCKQFHESEKIVFSVGSILQNAAISKCKNKIIIGSGSISDTLKINDFINFDILGVRGFFTHNLIYDNHKIGVPIISDFGLLLSEINLKKSNKDKKIGYVIHSVDRIEFFNKFPHLKEHLVNNYGNLEKFVEDLTRYEYIVSSSLHGLIFSHSFNIPCLSIKIGDKIIGGDFKFMDYYSSLQKDNVIKRTSYEQLNFYDESNLINTIKSSYHPPAELIQNLKNTQKEVLYKFFNSLSKDSSI